MLDFLVLGNIPGTAINISFESIILFTVVFLVAITLYVTKRHLSTSSTVGVSNSTTAWTQS